jgi:protein-S-isoprenylcysteine O-methyltransferase Ste14
MDSWRAYRKARRHRNIRVAVVSLVAVFLVAATVHLRSHWSVPGAWAAVLLGGVVALAGLIVLGVVVGRRMLRS